MSRRNPASAEFAPGVVSTASRAMPFRHPNPSAPAARTTETTNTMRRGAFCWLRGGEEVGPCGARRQPGARVGPEQDAHYERYVLPYPPGVESEEPMRRCSRGPFLEYVRWHVYQRYGTSPVLDDSRRTTGNVLHFSVRGSPYSQGRANLRGNTLEHIPNPSSHSGGVPSYGRCLDSPGRTRRTNSVPGVLSNGRRSAFGVR